MVTNADFLTAAQWAGIATLVVAAIAILSFILKWGIRFRIVGATGFMLVLTAGLFALGLVPFTRTVAIPGAVRYNPVYDSGSTQVVITVPPSINEEQLRATLLQAANDLYSTGRLSLGENRMTIRARVLIHPEDGVSLPLYLGEVKRSLFERNDEQMELTIFPDQLAQLPEAPAAQN